MNDETLFSELEAGAMLRRAVVVTEIMVEAATPAPAPPTPPLIDGSMSVEQIAAKVSEAILTLPEMAEGTVDYCVDRSCASLLHFAVVVGGGLPRRFTVTKMTLLNNARPGMMAELLKWKLRIGAPGRDEGVAP